MSWIKIWAQRTNNDMMSWNMWYVTAHRHVVWTHRQVVLTPVHVVWTHRHVAWTHSYVMWTHIYKLCSYDFITTNNHRHEIKSVIQSANVINTSVHFERTVHPCYCSAATERTYTATSTWWWRSDMTTHVLTHYKYTMSHDIAKNKQRLENLYLIQPH